MNSSRLQRLVLAAILMTTVVVGTRGITDEASVLLGGDMARYVMNGLFMYDLIGAGGAWSPADLSEYAERYFARYPALSLGHHPPLSSMALVPFLAVFGVSLFAARLAALTFFLLATWGLYSLTRRMLGWQAASWAAILFVTNRYVVRLGQYFVSEMPMVALVLAAVNALLIYCDTQKRRHFVWFTLAVVASLYAKQLAVFMFPVYGLVLITNLGWRSLLRRHVIVMTLVAAVLVAPLVAMTLALSPTNVAMVARTITGILTGTRPVPAPSIFEMIFSSHLTLLAAFAIITGTIVLALGRHRRVAVAGLVWILAVVGATVVFAGRIEPARYSFGATPAYCLLAAGWAAASAGRVIRWSGALILASTVLWQSWTTRDIQPSGAGGYEAAAQYVIDHSREPAILFDGSIDTGYFVFFVRKHDPGGRFLVLRADKMLAGPVREPAGRPGQIESPNDVYDFLHRFGVQFVVVEERNRGIPALKLLQNELSSGRFIERLRLPIVTRDPVARDRPLVVYEYLDASPPDPEAELDIAIPRGGREIRLRMKDMVGGGR